MCVCVTACPFIDDGHRFSSQKPSVRPFPVAFRSLFLVSQEEFECPPCPPLPKARERPLMISAEDEPPGRAPRVEVDVREPWKKHWPAFLGPTGMLGC